MTYKRLTLFAGHYGSGKTNIALNYARHLKNAGLPVTIADLDIVNPYFRTKDSEAALKAEGIELICSEFANSNLDVPAMPKEIYALVDDRSRYGVLDIGGDDRGALALGRYVPAILEENNGLIWSVVKRFTGRGTDLEDLYQLGCLGFIKAVEGFDLQFGTQFSTYAVPKIAGEIRRFLRDDGALKVSRSIKERSATIKSARTQLLTELDREPTISEISGYTGFSQEEIAEAETATAAVESISQQTGEDGFTLECILSDTDSEEVLLERLSLRQAIEKLPERESLVIKLRFFHGLTQDRVSKVLSVSQVQVSRIEKKALSKLKEMMS